MITNVQTLRDSDAMELNVYLETTQFGFLNKKVTLRTPLKHLGLSFVPIGQFANISSLDMNGWKLHLFL